MRNKKVSLGTNAILNGIKSSLSVLFPLIIYPYVFQVLHSSNMGKVNFAMSIVSYFSMFAMLGVSQYAVREGAKKRNNTLELNKFASEIFTINMISTIVSYLLLAVLIVTLDKLHDYKILIFICSISIIFTALGIEWVNTIFEDFFYITIRSIVVNIVTLILIFMFVKDESDIYIYAFLSILGTILTSIINWQYCRKYINLRITRNINIKKHIKPITILFANTLATNIYVNSDITMLGWFTDDYNVGIYSLSVKIYSVIKNIMAALYTVTVPRISFYIGNNDFIKVKELYTKLVCSIILLLLPASAGIISVAPEIIMFMGGEEYIEAIMSLRILGISLIGAIFAGLLTYCLNIPLGKEKINFHATIISACINVGLNVFLIKIFKQNGAAVTTVISEFSVFLYCLLKSKKELKLYMDVKVVCINIVQSLAGVVCVLLTSYWVHHIMRISLISLGIIVVISMSIYAVLLFGLKNEIIVGNVDSRR